MKKILFVLAFTALWIPMNAQQVSSRAKALRIMKFARPEYQVKDVKIFTDTMTVYALADQVVYPIGRWNTVEQYITNNQLLWTRESDYKPYFDSMAVSVNRLRRLDGTYIDLYRSITTGLTEILDAKITDAEVVLDNGIHPGMSKEDVFMVLFKKFPKSYTADIHVLKVVSGAEEVGQIYTFRGNKLKHIRITSKYKYY